MTIDVKLDTKGLDELIKNVPEQVDAAVRATNTAPVYCSTEGWMP